MSVIQLSQEDKRNISKWVGMKNCRLDLIYSAERDGCSPQAFHAKCDNQASLLVLASNTAGYVFGGYAAVPWTSTQSYPADPQAFLFRLKVANTQNYMKFPGQNNVNYHTAICCYPQQGPVFGNTGGQIALSFFYTNAFTKQGGQNFFTLNQFQVNFANGFANNGQDNNALHGGNTQIINIEVYTLAEAPVLCDPENSWRKGIAFHETALEDLKGDLLKFQPPKQLGIEKANILLVGQVGSGKSSFYNTLNSSFRGHVTGKAASGSAEHSVTSKYRQYDLRPGRGEKGLRVRLCDTMGLEDDQGLSISDVPYILDGHVQNGFQFNPAVLVTPDHPEYRATTKAGDRVHVVALVVAASSVDAPSASLLDKLRQVKKLATQRGIPVAVVLTKVDEVCEDVIKDVALVFRSLSIKERVDMISEKLGILRSFIHPVKNYDNEVELEPAVDVLALSTLRQLTRLADDYFEDQMEQRGYYDDDK